VSEALTNVAKHAQASVVEIDLEAAESTLRVTVSDDGIGAARPEGGSGLIGLHDRIESLGGSIEITSPEREGTRLNIEIPLTRPRSATASAHELTTRLADQRRASAPASATTTARPSVHDRMDPIAALSYGSQPL
jgi:signal transduction histidine kinase